MTHRTYSYSFPKALGLTLTPSLQLEVLHCIAGVAEDTFQLAGILTRVHAPLLHPPRERLAVHACRAGKLRSGHTGLLTTPTMWCHVPSYACLFLRLTNRTTLTTKIVAIPAIHANPWDDSRISPTSVAWVARLGLTAFFVGGF